MDVFDHSRAVKRNSKHECAPPPSPLPKRGNHLFPKNACICGYIYSVFIFLINKRVIYL